MSILAISTRESLERVARYVGRSLKVARRQVWCKCLGNVYALWVMMVKSLRLFRAGGSQHKAISKFGQVEKPPGEKAPGQGRAIKIVRRNDIFAIEAFSSPLPPLPPLSLIPIVRSPLPRFSESLANSLSTWSWSCFVRRGG